MTSLLWLLALAGGGALLPSLYSQTGRQHILLAPLLLALGYGLSPEALGFVSASAVREMRPALQMAVTWLALAAGLQVLETQTWRRHTGVLVGQLMTNILAAAWAALGVGIVLVIAQLGLAPAHMWRLPEILRESEAAGLMWGWGCLLAGTQKRMRPTDQVLLGCLGLIVLCSLNANMLGWTVLLAVGCAGIVGLLGVSTAAPGQKGFAWPLQTATLIGAAALTCGLAAQLGLPGVLVGFLVGACLKRTGLVPASQCRQAAASVRSVHMITLVLAGLSLRASAAHALWGAALGVVLLCMRLTWEHSRHRARRAGRVRILVREDNAERCVWLSAALLFITHRPGLAEALLPIVAIAAVLSDVFLWGAVASRPHGSTKDAQASKEPASAQKA